MALLITNRLMTRVGTVFMKTARTLAEAAFKSRQINKYQIINGFLLRATGRRSESPNALEQKDKGYYVAIVMDLPGFVFFGGSLSLPLFAAQGLAVPVGIRDDFDDPGTDASFTVLDKSTYFILPAPTRRRQASQENVTDWFPAVQQQDWFLGYSRMDLPLLRGFPDRLAWYLDDETYFTYDTIVALTGSITSMFTSARSLSIIDGGITVGEVATNYFLRNQYAIDESDLPGDWKLYPRRLVPREDCAPDYAGRRYPGITLSGFAIAPVSASTLLEGIDRYCHAARTFRQHQEPWGDAGAMAYDRYGEQGMLVAVGGQNRADYEPESGNSVFADTQSMAVIVPTDIEQAYLHPAPVTLPSDLSGRPELPNFGIFYTPTPARCGSSFAVFSAYNTFRNLGGQAAGPQSGDLWSLLTTLPGGRTVSLRADWNAVDGEIATGVPGEFMQPWIVGATSIQGEEDGATAYCLVWEQTYVRGGTTPIKGEWALYGTSGATPTRTTITGGAPLFAVLMKTGPTKFEESTYDVSNPMSGLYYAGNNRLVTACVDYPVPASGRSIKCAVFDVSTGSLSIGGEIAISNDPLDKCFVTAVQPFLPAIGDVEAKPAVLLATITRNTVGNDGAGKTYVSVDGGDTWREYIADAGGQGGAFYVGNKLWKFDINLGLDGRSRA
jgi:hypothetical protein